MHMPKLDFAGDGVLDRMEKELQAGGGGWAGERAGIES